MSTTPKSAHTEGPWMVEVTRRHPPFANMQVKAEDGGPIAELWLTLPDEGECVANARLISAAPDLLAALKDCARILPSYRSLGKTTIDDEACDAVLETVSEAIAKAEGGQ